MTLFDRYEMLAKKAESAERWLGMLVLADDDDVDGSEWDAAQESVSCRRTAIEQLEIRYPELKHEYAMTCGMWRPAP